MRTNAADKVFAVINFSDEPQDVGFEQWLHHDAYREYMSGEAVTFDANTHVALPPWSYRIYVR